MMSTGNTFDRTTFGAGEVFSSAERVHLFVTDQGGAYWLTLNGHGEKVATGERTRTEYRSEAHAVRVTGKRRWQGAAFGNGQRAVLTLDTGEGLETLKGVLA